MTDEPYDSDDEWFDEMLETVILNAALDDEAEDDAVEVDDRVRGVDWRDAYGDDQLGMSARASERQPSARVVGRDHVLLRVSRFLRRLIPGRPVSGLDESEDRRHT